MFAAYADALTDRFGRRPRDRALTMWSSWYSFYDRISEAELADVLDGIVGLDVAVFQVDDGWQRQIGDWTANDRFPLRAEGARCMSIQQHGHRPGLWLAPFIARDDSDLFRDRGDLVRHRRRRAAGVRRAQLGRPLPRP